ncbi:MAG: hypothetical protein A2Y73_00950 [Chloroflexi bacterium RBG_13_56_8]|nr:MAG: hypothetical protein A2Y73_00950 [Chloroflexi bacterium RBG_13_56_8]
MQEKHRWHHHLTINAYWLGVSFMWNSLHSILLPVLLLSFTPQGMRNTSYGILTFVGLLVAMVVQPLSGALSDGTRHALGRRRPWIFLGTLLDLACLLVLAMAGSFWVVAVGYMLLQLTSNLAHGPAQGLIPDLIPEGKRGFAAGVKNLFDMMGIIAAGLITGTLMSGATPRIVLTITVIAGILLVVTIVTMVGARETTTQADPDNSIASGLALEQLRDLVRVDFGAHRGYTRLLATRFCVLLATYLVQSFGLYYFRDALGMVDPSRAIGSLMAAVGVSVALAAYPAGALSERWGRKGITLAACSLTALGMALLLVVRSMSGLWILGGIIGLGMGAFASVNWAWATDLVPSQEAGKYLGLSNLATAGSAAVARLFGPGIDLVNSWWPHAGYSMLFLVATAAVVVGLFLTLGVPQRARDTVQKRSPKNAR